MKKNISSEIEVNKYISLVEGLYLNENDINQENILYINNENKNENDAEKKEQKDQDNDNIPDEDLNNNENIII